jgi:hypothetical protein
VFILWGVASTWAKVILAKESRVSRLAKVEDAPLPKKKGLSLAPSA